MACLYQDTCASIRYDCGISFRNPDTTFGTIKRLNWLVLWVYMSNILCNLYVLLQNIRLSDIWTLNYFTPTRSLRKEKLTSAVLHIITCMNSVTQNSVYLYITLLLPGRLDKQNSAVPLLMCGWILWTIFTYMPYILVCISFVLQSCHFNEHRIEIMTMPINFKVRGFNLNLNTPTLYITPCRLKMYWFWNINMMELSWVQNHMRSTMHSF